MRYLQFLVRSNKDRALFWEVFAVADNQRNHLPFIPHPFPHSPTQAPSQAPSHAPTHHGRDLQSSTSSVSPALVSHHQPNARAPDILSKEFSIVTLLLVLPSVVRRDLSRVVWNRVHLKYANASPSLPDLNCFQAFFL